MAQERFLQSSIYFHECFCIKLAFRFSGILTPGDIHLVRFAFLFHQQQHKVKVQSNFISVQGRNNSYISSVAVVINISWKNVSFFIF